MAKKTLIEEVQDEINGIEETALMTQAKEDITVLGFFACESVKSEISAMAEQSNGELTDEQFDILVSANTQSIVKLKGLCNFIKLLESKVEICKQRKKEINEGQKKAEGIVDNISDRLALWVREKGKTYQCEEYELATRLSKSVQLDPGFNDPFYSTCETVTIVTPNKQAIKEALENGEIIEGAKLEERINLTIK